MEEELRVHLTQTCSYPVILPETAIFRAPFDMRFVVVLQRKLIQGFVVYIESIVSGFILPVTISI